jgi:Tfp pilus assembly protein PilX
MNARGVALIAGLVLLATISLLALVAASGMILQKRMAANFVQDAQALENSEIATSSASSWLYSRPNHERESACVSDCILPLAIHNAGELPARIEYESIAWWRANGVEAGTNPLTGEKVISFTGEGSEPPRWILEEVHYQPTDGSGSGDGTQGVAFYRIIGRGTGTHPVSVAVTESIVARPWGGDYQFTKFPPGPGPGDFCMQFGEQTDKQFKCGRLAWRQRR